MRIRSCKVANTCMTYGWDMTSALIFGWGGGGGGSLEMVAAGRRRMVGIGKPGALHFIQDTILRILQY
jgi:hypothetical protein